CRFLGRRDDVTLHSLMRPASEKRQGTKSRWVGHPAVQQALWGLHVGAVDGIGSRAGHPHGRTLPQLSRFGMNVAQKGI
ncbi:MAG: hypothetical protein WBD95_01310, partial [Xanthobacteraceae bacterium]